jgi:hypothetical protein
MRAAVSVGTVACRTEADVSSRGCTRNNELRDVVLSRYMRLTIFLAWPTTASLSRWLIYHSPSASVFRVISVVVYRCDYLVKDVYKHGVRHIGQQAREMAVRSTEITSSKFDQICLFLFFLDSANLFKNSCNIAFPPNSEIFIFLSSRVLTTYIIIM